MAPALLPALFGLGAIASGLYDFSSWGLVAAGVLAALVAVLVTGGVRLTGPMSMVCGGLLVLLAGSAASMLWSDSVDRAWTEVHRLALYTGVLVLGTVAVRTPHQVRTFVMATAIAIAGPSIYALGTLVSGDPTSFVLGRLDAPVNYINGTAGLLLLGIWPALALAERRQQPVVAGLAMSAATMELGLLVLTQSRVAVPALLVTATVLLVAVPHRGTRFLALAVASACTAVGLLETLDVYEGVNALPAPGPADEDQIRQAGVAVIACTAAAGLLWAAACALSQRVGQRTRALAVAAVAVVCAFGVVATVASVDDPLGRISDQYERFVESDTTTTEATRFVDAGGFRGDLWRVALEQFRERPLGGVGAGSYGITYFRLRDNPESVRQPHNLGLQMLAELGLLGAAGVVALLCGIAWAVVRRRRDALLVVGCGGLVLAFGVHASVDWPWNLPALAGLALLAGGALVSPGASGRRLDRVHGRFAIASALVVIAVLGASLGRQWVADRHLGRAQDAFATDPATTLVETRAALALNGQSMESYYLRSAAFARFGDYPSARATLEQATRAEPSNYVPWALLGDIAVRRGDLGTAATSYGRALRRNPGDPALRVLANDPRSALP